MGQVLDSLTSSKIVVKDSTITDSTKVKKNFFNSGATYNAMDTVSINPKLKKITLYNNA